MIIMMIIINKIRKLVRLIIPMINGVKCRLFISRKKQKNSSNEERNYRLNKPSFISISLPQIRRDFFEQIDNFKYKYSLLIFH